jgi:hypothetical protein
MECADITVADIRPFECNKENYLQDMCLERVDRTNNLTSRIELFYR